MLTPAFDLSQDPDFLTIAIRVPYARVSEFDVYFEGTDFKFYAKPYFLRRVLGAWRLTLPGRIVENGSEQGSYDADKGASGVSEEVVENDDEEFDWEIEQIPYEEVAESALNPECHYGFGNLRSGVVHRLQDELSDVIDIKDPDFTPAAERRQKRLAAELAKFDPDHYLADFFEDEAVEQILKYHPWWTDTHSKMMAVLEKSQEQENHAALVSFSEEEKCQLRKFVNKSYLLDKRACSQAYYGLIDILLAYCYETCVTEGERNVESAWNIRKLSSTLCWFETWTNVHEIMVSFGRRVLCYPLYRHFKLVKKAYKDTIKILQLGKSAVLKCFLDIHKIFQENDPAYILNDLYISDYCVWIQKAKSKKLAALAEALREVSLTKAQLGLELEELEAAALLVQEEETALKAAQSVSEQQTLCSSSEASDSEESDSTPSSGTEDSDSDSEQEELKESQPETVNSLLGPFLEESSALHIDDGGMCRNTAVQRLDVGQEKPLASSWAFGVSGSLIEELGEQLKSTVQVSEPEGTTAVNHSTMRERNSHDAPSN
ncbi:protein SHQ1 homolog isoform X2 [Nycticebus coucang]|uniref:protein SHQ1 homolog isoform X2 n=1 Tax=Nycticebus coucang TaxID=9470 RepID=UPI00234D6346|nr:protein SHQ1 homolog isoform X2 [Nycticebus coucang]